MIQLEKCYMHQNNKMKYRRKDEEKICFFDMICLIAFILSIFATPSKYVTILWISTAFIQSRRNKI